MKKIITLLLCLGMLGACATTNEQTDKKQQAKRTYQADNIPRSIDKIIMSIEGCTKEFAFEAMGLPSGEKTIDGNKYFEWSIVTTYYPEKVEKTTCTIHAHVDKKGIIDHVYYTNIADGCKSYYVQIVRYYRTHSAQSAQTCPNRTEFYGKSVITKEY
ncbi:MAG: hypothetical protein IKP06_04495 [Elusimicrobiaceae bacterium]|nr:hypothetical protein [Elusimicrobiaceae bacterium]